jgi:peptidoglycan/LPS O-acetylase OafA/YrhL
MALSAGAAALVASSSPKSDSSTLPPREPSANGDGAPLQLQREARRALDGQPPASTRFLDGMRGLAAFYVLMRHVTWVPTPEDAGRRWLAVHHLLYRAFYYGHMAVIFFFVLSGFVIHLRYAKRLKDGPEKARFGWGDFVYRRARRLYPPLLGAILLTWIVDRLGTVFSFHTFYMVSRIEFSCIPEAISQNHRFVTLLGNLAFLMQMHVPVWGTDNPLWSLAYEWWFYMFYPVLWWLGRRTPWRSTLLVLGLFLLTGLPGSFPMVQDGPRDFVGWGMLSVPRRVFAALPAWWCGVLLADVYVGRIRVPFKHCAWFSFAIIVKFIPHLPEPVGNLAAAMGFCGIISLFFHLQQCGVRLVLLDKLKWLGDFSYTLYVTHWPQVIFMTPLWAWVIRTKVPRRMAPTLEFFTLMLVPLGAAYLLSLFVERPFTRTKKKGAATAAEATKRPVI